MKPTSITVVAHPDRIVPIPAAALRSPTGAQCKILGAAFTPEHPHELAGKVTLDLATAEVAQYVRRRINAGDLVVTKPDPPAAAAAAAPSSSPSPTPPAPPAATAAKD